MANVDYHYPEPEYVECGMCGGIGYFLTVESETLLEEVIECEHCRGEGIINLRDD